jgi:aryl-alcohol dehydrogenase-like predicted oxidoreductase
MIYTLLRHKIPQYNIPRHQIVIATKCNHLVAHDPSIWSFFRTDLKQLHEYVNQSGQSRAAIFNAVDASIARLETPYIDLLQIHRFDPSVTPEETMKALHDLVQSGKVRYIGASSMRCWQFSMLNEVAAKNGWTKFVSMQDEYSLLYREDVRSQNPLSRGSSHSLVDALCRSVRCTPTASTTVSVSYPGLL